MHRNVQIDCNTAFKNKTYQKQRLAKKTNKQNLSDGTTRGEPHKPPEKLRENKARQSSASIKHWQPSKPGLILVNIKPGPARASIKPGPDLANLNSEPELENTQDLANTKPKPDLANIKPGSRNIEPGPDRANIKTGLDRNIKPGQIPHECWAGFRNQPKDKLFNVGRAGVDGRSSW